MSENRVKAYVNRVINGKIRHGDLTDIILFARDRSDGRQSVEDIGGFIAHKTERTKGAITKSTQDWVIAINFHLPALETQKSINNLQSLPSNIIQYLRATLRLMGPRGLKDCDGINLDRAQSIIHGFEKKLKPNTDGTLRFAVFLGGPEIKLLKHLCQTLVVKGAYDGRQLSKDILSILESNRIITKEESRLNTKLRDLFQIYALAVMNQSIVVTPGHKNVTLDALDMGGILSITAPVQLKNTPSVYVTSSLYSSELLTAECCSATLIDTKKWKENLEVNEQGLLDIIT